MAAKLKSWRYRYHQEPLFAICSFRSAISDAERWLENHFTTIHGLEDFMDGVE
jgi:hypothetical protein